MVLHIRHSGWGVSMKITEKQRLMLKTQFLISEDSQLRFLDLGLKVFSDGGCEQQWEYNGFPSLQFEPLQ